MGHQTFNIGQRAVILFASGTLAADAATIAIAGIPATATNLRLVFMGRTDRAGNDWDNVKWRFNADTTAANYLSSFGFVGSSVGGGVDGSGLEGSCGVIGGATTPANEAATSVIELPYYTNTTWRKAWTYQSMNVRNGSYFMIYGGGRWANTAAITGIVLYPAQGTVFKAGALWSLYGLS